MKIEQNILQYASLGAESGYIDVSRGLSACNGKSITMTKRHDGKYKPLGYMIRVRALTGTGNVIIQSLNCAYPTRNSVVLAGAARDAMLKSAGVSRSNLESYQKELRIKLETGQNDGTTFFPGATRMGVSGGGWGEALTFDYTKLTIVRPDEAADGITLPLVMLGTQDSDEDNWDADTGFYVVDNWAKFRHNFTPSANADDIENNVFSWAMQQGSTAGDIIDRIDDEADERPYVLTEFKDTLMSTLVGIGNGNPTSSLFCAPLGLLKVTTTGDASWEVEVVGVTEL